MKKNIEYSILFLLVIGGQSLAQSNQNDCFVNKADQVPELYKGDGGLVLYESELSTNWNAWDNLIPDIAKISDAFKSKGVNLIILPIPARSMLYPNLIGRNTQKQIDYKNSDPAKKFSELISKMKSNNVAVVNVYDDLLKKTDLPSKDSNFFSYDFRWTQSGSSIAAKDLARAILPILAKTDYTSSAYRTYYSGKFAYPLPTPLQKLKELCEITDDTDFIDKFTTLPKNEVYFLGFSQLEKLASKRWRWANGPKSSLVIPSERQRRMQLLLNFDNPIKDQVMTIELNDKVIYKSGKLPQAEKISVDKNLDLLKGDNKVTLSFTDWNHKNTTFAKDPRKLTLLFNSISLVDDKKSDVDLIMGDVSIDTSPETALLDDKISPVTLIGTSYSNRDLNLDGFLKQDMSLDVLNYSISSGGIYKSLASYVNDTDFYKRGSKIVIWEIPMMWYFNYDKTEADKIISKILK